MNYLVNFQSVQLHFSGQFSIGVNTADLLRGLIDKIVLMPKASGTEYAIDLHGDLAGILTVAAGKQQKISDHDPLLQQVKMMTESGDQKHGWQEDSNADEISSKEDLSALERDG